MSLTHKTYSGTNGLNPNATKNATTSVISIILIFVVIIHLFIAFYLLKKTDLKQLDPTLLMSVEVHQQAGSETPALPTPSPAAPAPQKTLEKSKPVKIQRLVKKPAPPVRELEKLKDIPKVAPAPVFKPEEAPVAPQLKASELMSSESSQPAPKSEVVPAVSAPTTNNTTETKSQETNSELKPIYSVKPEYPLIAKRRGRNGWVRIELTVKADGAVDNAIVIEAEPEDIFNEAALTAIKEWKFKPKMVNDI